MNEDANKIVSYLRSRPWRLIAVAPWTLQLAILYLMTMALADCLQNGFRFGVGADAIIPLCAVFTLTTLSLSFRKARIVVGILALVAGGICLFSTRNGMSGWDFCSVFTVFFVGGLLLCKTSRQWCADVSLLNCEMSEIAAVVSAGKSVWKVLVAHKWLLGLVSLGVVLYMVGLITTIANNDVGESSGKARRTSARTSEQGVSNRRRQYQEKKAWYEKQLEYNGLKEQTLIAHVDKEYGDSYYLTLVNDSLDDFEIKLENMQYFSWPKSMAKGYAKELLEARIIILKFEDPEAGKKNVMWSWGKKD